MERYSNLTQYERDSLGRAFNLADGHARQYQDDAQLEICRRLPDLYRAGERISQLDVERYFQAAFYGLAGQPSATAHPRSLLCTSASLATDLVATFFGRAQLSVGLVQRKLGYNDPTGDHDVSLHQDFAAFSFTLKR